MNSHYMYICLYYGIITFVSTYLGHLMMYSDLKRFFIDSPPKMSAQGHVLLECRHKLEVYIS